MRHLASFSVLLASFLLAAPAGAGPSEREGGPFGGGRPTTEAFAAAAQGGKVAPLARSPLSTHVLDLTLGKPAAGVPVTLEYQGAKGFAVLATGTTDRDGRIANLLPSDHRLAPGRYRLTFETQTYFQASGVEGFYPVVQVVFNVTAPEQHYHIPLLLSPYGYSTYRGS